jgi:hypothetical protein
MKGPGGALNCEPSRCRAVIFLINPDGGSARHLISQTPPGCT